MWIAKPVVINNTVHKISLFEDASLLSYDSVICYWRENSDFRNFYFSVLQDSLFDAFFWENPPITQNQLSNTLMSLFWLTVRNCQKYLLIQVRFRINSDHY